MAKKQFKAESKRLLDLMINSIYTHKEIFLRELISNSSDALDKLYFRSLTDSSVGMNREDFEIRITADKESRILTVSDNGVGMTDQELESNLGTIAKSGTLTFKEENDVKKGELDVIGQFGVGFYSAFMVAKHIKVVSRAYGSEKAFCWESEGLDGYTVQPASRDKAGTDVILTIKENADEEDYDRFLSQWTIQSLVKKYSDYIRYPIRMMTEHTRAKEDSKDETETYMEDEVLNSQVPIWKKNKDEVAQEEYNRFYMDKFHDYEEPMLRIHTQTEGAVSYQALLFIPKRPPFDYYSKEYQRGLQLYSSGVMIMDKCEDLLPDYFGFVKGLVDSADLSLNISREMLQHNRQLKVIEKNIEKKIKSELMKLLESDRDQYVEFFKSFGLPLKYGMYAGYGVNKAFLQDLVMFHSADKDKLVTLKEYVEAMPEDQKDIYYACGESVERIKKLPQAELVRSRGYDVLCMTDDVDEFALRMLDKYMEKSFKSVADNDLDLSSDAEKELAEKTKKDNEDLLKALTAALEGKVKDVRLSDRLISSPVCLTADGGLSIEMEKVLKSMPMPGDDIKAERVLEINPKHAVFGTLQGLDKDDPKIARYARLLYDQALLIEGLPIEDPVEFSNSVCELMK